MSKRKKEERTIGFIAAVSGRSGGLQLCAQDGSWLKSCDRKSSEFYNSILLTGDETTLFPSRRSALRAIERTLKAAKGTGHAFDGATFYTDRVTVIL